MGNGTNDFMGYLRDFYVGTFFTKRGHVRWKTAKAKRHQAKVFMIVGFALLEPPKPYNNKNVQHVAKCIDIKSGELKHIRANMLVHKYTPTQSEELLAIPYMT